MGTGQLLAVPRLSLCSSTTNFGNRNKTGPTSPHRLKLREAT